MAGATVLSFARPGRPDFSPTQVPLFWSCSVELLSGGVDRILAMARNAFEISPGATKFIRRLEYEVVWQDLKLIQPATAFDSKTLLGFEEVRCRAQGVGLVYANPLSVLSWAILAFNPNLERGEINIGMRPLDGHYLVFINRGTRCKPRLVLQPTVPNRKYHPDTRWIFATGTTQ